MSAPQVRGWCPGALRPMLSGDGLVVRVRPPMGRLTPRQATGLAGLAAAWGNGHVQLTRRAAIQVRGVTAEGLALLHAGLAALGLLDPSMPPEAEGRLNIMLTPFASGAGSGDAAAIWAELAAALSAPDAPPLPAKFGFAIDCAAGGCDLTEDSADVRVETCGAGLMVRADGAARGLAVADAGAAVAAAIALARWFVASGGVGADGRGRMREHLARGARLPPALAGEAAPRRADPARRDGLVHLAFGHARAECLAVLAALCTGDGLRLTPWRALHLDPAPDAQALSPFPDLFTDPADPRARVFACVGAPGCAQAAGDTRGLATRIAAALPRGATGVVHVAGCAKGCAHPEAADLTLVARAGGTYARGRGTTADHPALAAGHPAQAVLEEATRALRL
jgi:precorrin-3B synthase